MRRRESYMLDNPTWIDSLWNLIQINFMIFYYLQPDGFLDLNFWPAFLSFDIPFVSLKCVFCVLMCQFG